jgi:hypothetical protein
MLVTDGTVKITQLRMEQLYREWQQQMLADIIHMLLILVDIITL